MTDSRNATLGRFAMRSALQTGLLAAAMTLVIGVAGAQQDNGGAAGGAQPGQGGVAGARQGRQGRGGPGGQGGPGGGFGAFGGQMPFSMGTVTGGDPATGTIIIKTITGSTQTIKVNLDAKFVVMSEVLVSSLKLGDQVQVQGIPASITANTISAGALPDVLTSAMGGGRRNRGGAPGGQPGQPGAQADAANPNGGQNAQPQVPQAPPAMASASGKIVSKDPLMIELSDSISVTLKISEKTKITKIMPATINTIKLNDTILASGTAGADGTFTATGIGINVNMGGMGGRGMFGGGPGGGFGGPGGGGPGGGGGRRGGRGGGQGGNAGGANAGSGANP